jgi:hypothetical protein
MTMQATQATILFLRASYRARLPQVFRFLSNKLEPGRIQDDAHKASSEGTGQWNGQEPAHEDPPSSLPVDGTDIAVAQSDT